MRKVTLESLLFTKESLPYEEQYQYILSLLENGIIKEIKSSPRNGKKPSLPTAYYYVDQKPKIDYTPYREELFYQLSSKILVSYYEKHIDKYVEERDDVLMLNDFLRNCSYLLDEKVSMRERAYQIWGWEKKFEAGNGKTILQHCGIELSELNVYQTAEPFAYFAANRKEPQNILIVENVDPFVAIRTLLSSGKTNILGINIGTVIFGSGNKAPGSFKEFETRAEPYMCNKENRFLYIGDLDYEGIGIFERTAKSFALSGRELKPFVQGYQTMLNKADTLRFPLNKSNKNQRVSGGHVFFSYFSEVDEQRMKAILMDERYIAQEILVSKDYIGRDADAEV